MANNLVTYVFFGMLSILLGLGGYAFPYSIYFVCGHITMTLILIVLFVRSAYSKGSFLFLCPISAFIIIHIIYFSAGSFKYFFDMSEYVPITLSTLMRYIGSCCGFFILAAMILISNKSLSHVVSKKYVLNIILNKFRTIFFLYLFSLALKIYFIGMGYGSTYAARKGIVFHTIENPIYYYDRIIYWFNLTASMAFVTFSFLALSLRSKAPTLFKFAIIVVLFELSWDIFFYQSRLLILIIAVNYLFYLKEKNLTIAKFATFFLCLLLPITISSISNILLYLMDRNEAIVFSLDGLSHITYRLDLTDIALDLALNSGGWPTAPQSFIDGFFRSLPKLLVPSKYLFVSNSYLNQFVNIGYLDSVYSIIDFPDTLFSSGVAVGGIIGFFLWPLLIAGLILKATKFCIYKLTDKGPAALFVIVLITSSAYYIELGAGDIFTWYRNFIVLGLTGFIINSLVKLLPSKRVM